MTGDSVAGKKRSADKANAKDTNARKKHKGIEQPTVDEYKGTKQISSVLARAKVSA